MKKSNTKSKIYLSLQIIFMILTFVGGILLFIGKMDYTDVEEYNNAKKAKDYAED